MASFVSMKGHNYHNNGGNGSIGNQDKGIEAEFLITNRLAPWKMENLELETEYVPTEE